MPAGDSGNSPSVSTATLTGGKQADAKFDKIIKQFRDAGADGAAQRFEAVGAKARDGKHHFEDLEQDIDPDRAIDELNSARGRVRWGKLFRGDWRAALRPLLGFPKSVRYAHLLRNVAALAPLIFTWIVLGMAAERYGRDLKAHPRAAADPFLLLWQQGFGNHFISFERVTFIDFTLLALVVLLTIWVHWAEGQADRSADSVYEAVDSLKEDLAGRHSIPTPLTPVQWAKTASGILSDTVQQTRELNAASELAIREASERLTAIQDKSQEFIREFKDAVLQTLTSVTEQNESFIENTRKTNQDVLQALVEQQMEPLLGRVQELLDQFRTQQSAYTVAVTDLVKNVGLIKDSAVGLATSARAFDGSTQAIAGSLAAMATSQERFASSVDGSAQSMGKAATAMTEVKDALRTDLHERLEQMTGNITGASASLKETQEGMAHATEAIDSAAEAFNGAADALARTLKEPMDLLRRALSQGVVGSRRRRRFLFFSRRS